MRSKKHMESNEIMITVKTLLGKMNSLPFPDEMLIAEALQQLDRSRIKCPACGAIGRCRPIGAYKRMMITVVDGMRSEIELKVPRVRCDSCQHTHSLISDVLIPHGSYTLRFILYVLAAYLRRCEPVAQLCERWAISISTLYSWIHLFLEQHNIWARALERISWVTEAALSRIKDTPAFPASFFERFKFFFLQRPTTRSHLPRRRRGLIFLP